MKRVTVTGLCELSGITRQAYYKERRQRRYQQFNAERILELVHEKRSKHPRMGGRKLHHELSEKLKERDMFLGRDRFFKLLIKNDLLVKPRRSKTKTTNSRHKLPMYRNLIEELRPTAPNQLWVSDITYLKIKDRWSYLSLITDAYSRKILGWHASDSLETSASTINALKMALEDLPANRWPIHHSDRGSQYCCLEYTGALKERGLSISMTEQNHCYENAYAERVNGILKGGVLS